MTAFLLSVLLAPVELSYTTWPVFQSYLCGPGRSYSDPCGEMVDYDSDVDLQDLAAFQNLYRCVELGEIICGHVREVEVP